MDWQTSGQFGDTVGGIANLITLLVVVLATLRFLPRELAKVRAEHVLQAHAGAATAVWTATFELLLSMEALAHPASWGRAEEEHDVSNAVRFQRAFAERMARFNECANGFLRCWSVAELHFDADVDVLLKEIWKAKAKLQVDHMMYQQGLATGHSPASDHEALFGEANRESFKALRLKAKTILRPYALATKEF